MQTHPLLLIYPQRKYTLPIIANGINNKKTRSIDLSVNMREKNETVDLYSFDLNLIREKIFILSIVSIVTIILYYCCVDYSV